MLSNDGCRIDRLRLGLGLGLVNHVRLTPRRLDLCFGVFLVFVVLMMCLTWYLVFGDGVVRLLARG